LVLRPVGGREQARHLLGTEPTGSLRGSRTPRALAVTSGRSTVTSRKKRSAVSVALKVRLPTPYRASGLVHRPRTAIRQEVARFRSAALIGLSYRI
jgi:hypothetical protein